MFRPLLTEEQKQPSLRIVEEISLNNKNINRLQKCSMTVPMEKEKENDSFPKSIT